MVTNVPEDVPKRSTFGVHVPVLQTPRTAEIASVQLLGTVNDRRGRWNPFLPDNDMVARGRVFEKSVELRTSGGRHGDGIYALRFAVDHDLRRLVKADHGQLDDSGRPRLVSGVTATHNLMIRVRESGQYRISLDPETLEYHIEPGVEYLTQIESMQLNGFVWDDESDFGKFDETRASHDMTRVGARWEITVPLRKDGGISFRRDGVYQFLVCANRNEDWGFGADNAQRGRLSGGTGFGSSGGCSSHSAITVKVVADGLYTVSVDPVAFEFEVKPSGHDAAVELLNEVSSVQVLGNIHRERPFDPTSEATVMQQHQPGRWIKEVTLEPGVYGINFGLSRELFLDTMALGAWVVDEATGDPRAASRVLKGRAWHGKPNEPNIFFEVLEAGRFEIGYELECDEFEVRAVAGQPGAVRARPAIESLQLVGSFDEPLAQWNPESAANDMQREGTHVFTKDVFLVEGRAYQYKYNANHWPWLWVFADYELDGFGSDYIGANPDPRHSRLEELKRYGQLTTHGNPQPLEYVPPKTGYYTFTVDLETGAYNVAPTVGRPHSRRLTEKKQQIMSNNVLDHESFIAALKSNRVSLVERALADGLDPNFKSSGGYTPLMLASGRSQTYMVDILIEAGADVNVVDNRSGNSALHFAAMSGTGDVAKKLINHGAFINLQNPSQGHTPLIDAVIYKNPAAAAVLLDEGANLNIKNHWGHSAEDFIGDLLEQPNTEKTRIQRIKGLFEDRKARDARTRDEMKLFKAVLDNDVERVKACIRDKEDLDARYPVESTGNDGHTALLAAARDGRGEITALLLEAGANPYIGDYLYKAFPIFKSCYMGQKNTAQIQVDHGVDLAVQGPWNGYSPLHDALWQGHVDIAELLVKAGADLTLTSINGRTPLDMAIIEYGEGHPIVNLIRSRLPQS